jgi:hypothetical protein
MEFFLLPHSNSKLVGKIKLSSINICQPQWPELLLRNYSESALYLASKLHLPDNWEERLSTSKITVRSMLTTRTSLATIWIRSDFGWPKTAQPGWSNLRLSYLALMNLRDTEFACLPAVAMTCLSHIHLVWSQILIADSSYIWRQQTITIAASTTNVELAAQGAICLSIVVLSLELELSRLAA